MLSPRPSQRQLLLQFASGRGVDQLSAPAHYAAGAYRQRLPELIGKSATKLPRLEGPTKGRAEQSSVKVVAHAVRRRLTR